jgi:hypothetical protein
VYSTLSVTIRDPVHVEEPYFGAVDWDVAIANCDFTPYPDPNVITWNPCTGGPTPNWAGGGLIHVQIKVLQGLYIVWARMKKAPYTQTNQAWAMASCADVTCVNLWPAKKPLMLPFLLDVRSWMQESTTSPEAKKAAEAAIKTLLALRPYLPEDLLAKDLLATLRREKQAPDLQKLLEGGA